ncbi:MAG TPA: HD-GYP domain-containing protein [Solirubrobacteraceae bacterium]|nr:HD-GYP domain-containing protein [Solirubrobacteraceae bacterium]
MVSDSETRDTAVPRRALEHTAAVQRLLLQGRPRLAERMPRQELRAELIVAGALIAVAAPLAVLAPHRGTHSPAVVALFVLLYAVMSMIQFDVAAGYGAPTQLVLVPMLYVLPPGAVPLLVAAGLIIALLPSYISGTRNADRVLSAIANSWHAVGPAIVFAVAGLTTPRWSQWPVLLIALAAQLVTDLGASVAREWLRLKEVPTLSVRLLGSVYLTDVCLSPIGFAVAFAAAGRPAAALIVLPLGGLLMFFARDRRVRMAAALELSHAYRGTALLLGDVVEADDAYTGAHSRDVVQLVMAVGPLIGLDEEQLRRLEFGALLHDVGKIAVPKEILNKAGPLTEEERRVINTHTVVGQEMLENVGGVLGEVGTIVRSTHERYDGLGYPDGLAGQAIPIEARIIACCDAFNAMTTDRPYRSAMPLQDALAELRQHRGTQFDPDVVGALLGLLKPETQ